MRDPPHWWTWEFELTDHVRDRMLDRDFTEVDLLEMIELAVDWYLNHVPGRFVLLAGRAGKMWEVIVEPDDVREVVDVVTAYESDAP